MPIDQTRLGQVGGSRITPPGSPQGQRGDVPVVDPSTGQLNFQEGALPRLHALLYTLVSSPNPGDAITYDQASNSLIFAPGGASSGALGGLFPDTLGQPGQILKLNADRTMLLWANDDTASAGTGIDRNTALGLIANWARFDNTDAIPVSKIPAEIARDSEVASAVAAEASQRQTQDTALGNRVTALENAPPLTKPVSYTHLTLPTTPYV